MHWFIKVTTIVIFVLLLWSVTFLTLPKILPPEVISNSEVHGLLIRDQIWGGTMRVTGDLITGPNTTITLKPDTKILVAVSGDKNNFDFLPWHNKSGVNVGKEYRGVRYGEPFWDEGQKIQIHFDKLIAIGTKEQPITITSDSVQGSPYDFNVLSIGSGILSQVKLSNYRRLEVGRNTAVRDSDITNTGECAICITSGKPSIINNVFSKNLREYIWVYRASPKISDNEFKPTQGAGIRVDPSRIGSPVIIYNNFEMPQSFVLDFLGGAEDQGGIISSNKFAGGTTIQIPCDSKLKIFQNSILGMISFATGSCVGSYTFGPNYWGAQNSQTILSDQIILKEKQFKVLIPVILKEPPSQTGRRN